MMASARVEEKRRVLGQDAGLGVHSALPEIAIENELSTLNLGKTKEKGHAR
jgi:hypothetical protein